MKETITYRFNKLKNKNIGSIITLAQSISSMNYGRQKIVDFFNKYVPKSEYEQNDKEELLNWLFEVNHLKDIPYKV